MQRSCYMPTSLDPSMLIGSLNDSIPHEIAVPGTWSPELFYLDMKQYPVVHKTITSKRIAEILRSKENTTYLEFFEETRGYARFPNLTPFQSQVFEIFERGSIMLYFEKVFLKLIDRAPSEEDLILFEFLKKLSGEPITDWNETVAEIGACCFQFFAKEPYSYMKLIYWDKAVVTGDPTTDYENMKDQELLARENITLEFSSCPGKLSIEDSRSKLLSHIKAKLQAN